MADDQIRLIPDCKVTVAGSPLDLDKDARLARVRVDLDADLFGLCQLTFHDPKLALINGSDFACGTAIAVQFGFGSKLVKVFEGEVTALEPMFRRDLPPALRVECQESLHRLALSQMTRALNDVDDKEIATKVAQEHGLSAEAPAGSKGHSLQAAVSDAVLLRRIAQKHGNTLRIEGKKLIIGPPAQGAEVAITRASGLQKMKVKISAQQQVSAVEVRGWDPKAKQEVAFTAKPEGETGEGARQHGGSASIALAGHEPPPADTATAESMAKGRLRKIAEGFIVGAGEMIGDPRVVPGAVLALEKIGEQIDGSYRVDHAEHLFSKHGYFVRFRGVKVGKKKAAGKALKAQDEKGASAATDSEQEAAKDRAQHGLTNPRWGQGDHQHGDYGEMIVDAKNLDGKIIQFVAYHQEPDGNWTEFARKHVVASGEKVSAKLKLLHEDHPDTPAATKAGKRPVGELLQNARWGKGDHDHGDTGEMTVDVRHGNDGAPVVFVVEKNGPNGWEPYGTVQSKVDGDQARASVAMVHPGGAQPDPVELRFTAHVQIDSTPRAVKFDATVL